MKKIIIFVLLIGLATLGYYFLNHEKKDVVYTDSDVVVGFVEVKNTLDLSFTKHKIGDETMVLESARFFTDDFYEQDLQSAGACSKDRIANGGYEIYLRTVTDYTDSSAVDMSKIVKRVEGTTGANEVKMITIQDIPFIYSQGDDSSCGHYVIAEGVTTPDTKVVVTMLYYREAALEDFDTFINSLEFLNT